MKKIQSQGVHHITLNGADRQTSIDFWEGVLGMPFVFDQPNLDNPREGHLYFDPGDGRLITVFTNEDRKPDPRKRRTIPARSIMSPSVSATRPSPMRRSGWRRGASPSMARRIGVSWIRSIFATRWAF